MSAETRLSAWSSDGTFTVVGAGVGGLATSILLRQSGAKVEILEKVADVTALLKTNTASYNLTLNPAGRRIVARLGLNMSDVGCAIVGRRIVAPDGAYHSFKYGLGPEDHLLSIPRQALIERLVAKAKELRIEITPNRAVLKLEAARGVLVVQGPDGIDVKRRDRIVAADGVASVCREDVARVTESTVGRVVSDMRYTTVCIPAAIARQVGLDRRWIYFSSGPGATAIGLPNSDGSVSLILEWIGGETNAIEDLAQARTIIAAFTNQYLLRLVPDLEQVLIGRRIRRFSYVTSERWVTGPVGLVGDAAHSLPPYLGTGVNSALLDATVFSESVRRAASFRDGLHAYEQERQIYARELDALARQHEAALKSGRWGDTWWRARQRFDALAEQAFGARTTYQRLVFDKPLECVRHYVDRAA